MNDGIEPLANGWADLLNDESWVITTNILVKRKQYRYHASNLQMGVKFPNLYSVNRRKLT